MSELKTLKEKFKTARKKMMIAEKNHAQSVKTGSQKQQDLCLERVKAARNKYRKAFLNFYRLKREHNVIKEMISKFHLKGAAVAVLVATIAAISVTVYNTEQS